MIYCKKPFAIVILNYNGKAYLEKFLQNVIANSFDLAEIIVADNNSTDLSIQYLESAFPEIKTIKIEKNYGYAGGYNVALEQVDAPYFVLLNSDVEVTKDWLQPVYHFLEENQTIAGVQPKILSFAQKNLFEHAGASGGMIDYLGYPFCRGRIFDTVESDSGQYDDIQSIAWASGAAMIVRKDIFNKFGGLDADFFAHMEEIDLCWRVKNAGYDWKVIPSSVVYHVGGGTLDYDNPRKTYLNFRNSLWCLQKNDTSGWVYLKILYRLLLDGVAGLQFLLKGKSNLTIAIIKSHWSFFPSFFKTNQKRSNNQKLIQQNRIGVKNENGVLNQSIVFQYFGKRKKMYSDLYPEIKN